MGIIMDISHHQNSSAIDWAKAAKEVDLAIIRVQYGSNLIDRQYKNHVANCKKHGIPFGHYAYGMYVSVNDAVVEAKDFINRADKDALFLALDVEKDTVNACGTKNLSKASQAFIDTLKKAGHKTGYYVSHELYKKHGLDKVKADFLWLPRYGKDNGKPDLKPNYACDLWQYSQYCRVSWYNGALDFNLLNGSKSLSYFTGGGETKSKTIDQLVKETLAGKHGDGAKRKQSLGSQYDAVQKRVNEKLLGSKPKAKATYHTVKSGDTVSGLAVKYGSTQAQIKSWNNLKNINLIQIGQKLRVK